MAEFEFKVDQNRTVKINTSYVATPVILVNVLTPIDENVSSENRLHVFDFNVSLINREFHGIKVIKESWVGSQMLGGEVVKGGIVSTEYYNQLAGITNSPLTNEEITVRSLANYLLNRSDLTGLSAAFPCFLESLNTFPFYNPMQLEVLKTAPSEPDYNNGVLQVNLLNGIEGNVYEYALDNGAFSANNTFTGLSVGKYAVKCKNVTESTALGGEVIREEEIILE